MTSHIRFLLHTPLILVVGPLIFSRSPSSYQHSALNFFLFLSFFLSFLFRFFFLFYCLAGFFSFFVAQISDWMFGVNSCHMAISYLKRTKKKNCSAFALQKLRIKYILVVAAAAAVVLGSRSSSNSAIKAATVAVVRDKMAFIRSEPAICAPPCPSDVFPTLLLKRNQTMFV